MPGRLEQDAMRESGTTIEPSDAVQTNGASRTEGSVSGKTTLLDVGLALQEKVGAFLDQRIEDATLQQVQAHARVSIDVIREALYRYGPDHLSLSYNGGKDCLVLLVLILACLPRWSSDNPTLASKLQNELLQAIYIVSREPFPEVEDFVAASARQYHLELRRYPLPMRPALEAYLADKPNVEAIFMGTRRTDPHCEKLTHFSPTDKDWPQFMRVNPVIDWHYADIWVFIRHLDIPFCSLYNQGFTSLGGIGDTRPNPVLALDADAKRFRPAYELVHDDEERLGRDR